MQTLFQDLKYGARGLLKQPAFALVAILALALGIGLNGAFFSMIDAILIKPINLPDADRTVVIWEAIPSRGVEQNEVAPANYLDWKAQSKSFDEVALYTWWSTNLTGVEPPERVRGFRATPNLFVALGIQPALGRGFNADEDQPGKDNVVMLSHGLWQRRFAGDLQIVGKSVRLNGISRTVVGVLPKEQNFPRGGEVFVPLVSNPQLAANRNSHGYLSVARLKQGITVEQAQADVAAIAGRLAAQFPESNTGRTVVVRTVLEDTVRNYKRLMPVFWGAAFFVLLIACANVANLLLARSAGRGREISLRLALGATRWRIVRQLLTESVVLALLGGVLGVLGAFWGVELLKASLPDDAAMMMPGFDRLGVNWRVLGYMAGISVLTGILFGLAPGLQSSKPDLSETLNGAGKSIGGSRRNRLRGYLVVAEVALSLVLLIGAGLMMRSFLNVLKADPGFNPEGVVTMSLTLPVTKYGVLAQREAFFRELIERVERVPGMDTVGVVNYLPLGQSNSSDDILIEGQPEPPPGEENSARYRVASSEYFRAMKIGLLEGRFFTDRDRADAPPVVIINDFLARRFWPNGDAVGKRFRLSGPIDRNPWMEVVGVVGNVRHEMNLPITPDFFRPYGQDPWSTMSLVARTRLEPGSQITLIRREVQGLDPDQPVAEVRTMVEVRDRSIMHYRLSSGIIGLFGFFALLLAASGIYGVMSYFVSQRTQEIGVRMALGAQRHNVLQLVIRQGMLMVAGGIGVGLIGAFALTRGLTKVLYEVNATDWQTYVFVTLVLGGVGFLACFIPARRATRVDPMVALRYE
ncbi:MAG: ABC transporter permease [Acidobacteriota bacterium]